MTSTTSKYILDSHAWIEYFRGTTAGEIVKEKIEGKNCITPTIVIAEIADMYSRHDHPYFNSDMEFIETNSTIMQLDRSIAKKAGKLKNAVRKQYKSNFGLADAIILASALSLDAKVLTGDHHFKKLKNVEYIK